ncbi:MAG: GMC family oxidoreductase N-terminal domain-containing protein [Bacteroidetes bacterium]|nr:GMC family oxidoreductase N-terminal domain-containing protein [Bacteroidota bacterium]
MLKHRLSKPTSEIKSDYEVVVIGSGYGGSIAASRMARAGRKVCLMERGREIRPGDYPDKKIEAGREVHVNTPELSLGRENSLYQFIVNDDISVFQGCGLGGTSLVNANVSLAPEEWVFQDHIWPAEIRMDLSGLYKGIERAKTILQPVPYPTGEAGYPELPKVTAQQKSASVITGEFKYTPINVRFKDGPNAVGYNQRKCTNCGDCVTGCNVGAKNTTLMNYLPDAVNFGAEIYTNIEVSYLSHSDDGKWLVHFSVMGTGAEKFGSQEQFITADFVFLGAGSLGSTGILLQSKAKGLTTSDHLGKRFTGNGDVLGFAYNADQQISGVGLGHLPPDDKHTSPGPCIASVIDTRKEGPKEEGMVIQEGVIPGALSAVLPGAFITLSRLFGKDTDSGFKDFVNEKLREVISFFGGAYKGALKNTQTYLVMSHDDGQGEMYLEKGKVRIKWPGVGKQEIIKKAYANLFSAAKAIGATFMTNPSWNKLMDYDLVTVHPLGGCGMAEDAERGVVNHKGQVFRSNSGNEVFTNLIVCDGAIIPRPLGVNPLLTISGLAERVCELIAEENEWTIDYSYKPIDFNTKRTKPGIQFTESMTGFIHKINGSNLSYEDAYSKGKEIDNEFTFVLTIKSEDVETFLAEPEHEASMSGTVDCRLLSFKTISAHKGSFNLFVKNKEQVDTLNMLYRMELHSEEGEDYFLEGFKEIKNDPGFDVWTDITTLFFDIYKGLNNEGEKIANGILKIKIDDLKKQMQTIKVTNGSSKKEELKWLVRFCDFFTDNLTDTYGGILKKINLFDPDAPSRQQRQLNAPDPVTYPFKAKDGVDLELTRYDGGGKGPIMLIHGLGVSSLIFSIDTIETNLVEFLCKEGYDLWLIDNRVSIKLPVSEKRFSGDDVAINDYEPAVELIKKETNREKVHVIAHCFGSTTFTMSLLNGLQGIASLVISQIGPHVKAHPTNVLKSKLHLPELMEKIGLDKLTAYTDTNDSWIAKVFNSMLKFYPYDKEDKTIDPVSNRITFLYGQLYELDQLNQATFDSLHELFGLANIEAFTHTSEMIRSQKVVNKDGDDVYMPQLQRAMSLPVTFIHGEENACFLPESTKETYEMLKKLNPAVPYERHVIPEYGHIDCIFGKNAYKDVYPLILKHFEKHV